MKTLLATAAAAALFATTTFAVGPLDADDAYDSVLFDLNKATVSSPSVDYRGGESAAAGVLYSNDTYGSVLFDLESAPARPVVADQPLVGGGTHDYGSVLYDL